MRCLSCSRYTPYVPERKRRDCIACGAPVWLDTHENFIDETTRIPPGIRESQVAMAQFIDTKLLDSALSSPKEPKTNCLAIQAEVGIGKTLAYLLPALNTPGNVIVSTATTNLQRQITKELARISVRYKELFGAGFQFVVLKGGSNYLCQHAMDDAHARDAINKADYKLLSNAWEYARKHGTGEMGDAVPPVPEHLRMFAYPRPRCLSMHCSYAESCGYTTTKRLVAARPSPYRVVVVNHALLSQMVLRAGVAISQGFWGALRDNFKTVIIDEGHEFIEYLQRAFELEFNIPKYRKFTYQIERNIPHTKSYCEEARTAVSAWRKAVLAQFDAEGGFKRPDTDALLAWEDMSSANDRLMLATEKGHKEVFYELREYQDALLAFARDYMKFAEDNDGKTKIIIKRPISRTAVQNTLGISNTIFTSGTLAVDEKFDHLATPLGLTFPESNQFFAASPFDFERQAVFYMPDNPGLDPRNARGSDLALQQYISAVAEEVETLVRLTNGFGFVLFCAKREMFGVLRKLGQKLRERGHTVPVQDGSLKTEEVLRDYVDAAELAIATNRPGPVLFGLNSFWHGVSVEKEALQLVIVTKLWFPHPDDPQMAFMQEQLGRAAFPNYSVPEAIKKIVQAEGRLIRTKDDFGIFALLDYRLRNTKYGKRIRNSLKTAQNTVGTLSYLEKEWDTIKTFMSTK